MHHVSFDQLPTELGTGKSGLLLFGDILDLNSRQEKYKESNNLQYNTLGRWINWTIVSLTICLIFQLLFLFQNFLQNSLQKFFQIFLFFHNFTKIKSFECPKSKPATHCLNFQSIKLIHTWTIRPLVQHPLGLIP